MSTLIAEGFELSPQQKQLWRLQQAEPDQPYRAQCAILVEGQVDAEILSTALRSVFKRHEILHTTFSCLPGMKLPLQVITDAELAFEADDDLSCLSFPEQQAHLNALLEQAKQLPFGFAHGPLAYASLVRISSSRQILLLTLGGLCTDAIGLDNLVGELSRSYTASLDNVDLSEEPIQYIVASQYFNELLESDDAETGRQYWRKQGVADSISLKLPFENPTPAITSFEPAVITSPVDADLVARLRTFARSQGASPSSILLAAWQVFLSRLAGSSDLTVGLSCDGRTVEELKEAVGLFARYVPLHSRLQVSSTFRDIVQLSDESARDAYAWQDCFSWNQLEESSDSGPHFFPYCFEFVEQPTTYGAAGVSFSIYERYTCLDRFKVKLSCAEKNDSLTAEVHYDSNRFAREDMQRLAGNFLTLLESALNEPDAVINKLDILSPHEREQLSTGFNAARTTYPDSNLSQLFEQQVERTPHSVAVVFENQQVTYAELNSQANQLARYLRRLGVGPQALVAVCIDRSIEMVVGLLGILKAGGAYLPLDPTYPIERLTFMLEDAQPSVLLTQERLLTTLKDAAEQVVCLDTDRKRFANESSDNLINDASAGDLAYVIYTSGSTNRPKGVMIPHGAISNHMFWFQEAFSVSERDIVLQKTPFSFDASVWEFYAPLLTGGRLIMALPGGQQDSAYLVQAIKQEQVTLLQVVPSLLRMLLTEAKLSACHSLRYVFAGGEALPVELQQKFSARLSAAKLANLYGPTETTVDASFHVCEQDGNGLTVPIGRPIANNQIYLLDQNQQMTPRGVPGEIYIGGAGVGRGYLNRPDLTAAAFVPDVTHGGERGGRLYKTGDLGRYLPDANVEFLGRVDHQVKLRGFRIELGEIEAVLGQHATVRSAVVLVKDNTHLVAYVVPDQEQSATTSELRTFLQTKLPEHMVPSVFVSLDRLPLTPNGKVDRKALAAFEKEPESETEFVAPRTPVEQEVAAIWARHLGVEQIGINHDFFEMGGHSILASELMAEVRDKFQVALPLRSLFEKPTVAGLSQAIAEYKDQRDYVPIPVIVPAPEQRYEPFPLTDIQQAYWVGRSGAIELGNVSAHGYKEFDFIDLDVRRLELALQALIERHDMLRAIILPDGRQQILKDVPPYEVKILDVREATPEVADAELEAVRQDLSHEVRGADQWPLFQLRASLLNNGRVRVHISVDALIGDAWSWQLLGRELAQIYEDPALALVPLELSFRDYILAVDSLRQTELYRRSRDYWFGNLATLPPAPDLPLATNARSIGTPVFTRQTFTLEPDAWRRIKARGAQSGLTASGILLAAFSEVLAIWSKSPRFTINVTVFNRLPLHPQVNDILGDFTSVNLLAVDNSEPDSFENRARRIQERLWNDLDHRYVSGVEVIRELARLQGGSPRGAAMPIVFTSTLHHNAIDSQSDGAENPEQSDQQLLTLANPEDDGYGINQTPQVWLDHQVYDHGGALVFNWDAVAELFPKGFLQDMFEAYCRLLQELAEDEATWQKPARQLLSSRHLEQLAMINATTTPVSEALAHQFFIDQVSQRPHHPAVSASSRTLTYEELYRRANHLGRRLRDAGARPNQLVGVVMQKGWEQVVAVLATLQAGAAYLPIDANFPQDRIWSLLENGQVTWVLTQSWIDQKLAWPEHIKRFSVDQQELDAEVQPLEPIQKPEDLAYVIYTSGSTGVPKGVMIEHRNVANRIADVNQRFGVGPEDRTLALTALHHDLSVYDIFGVLGAGGTIVMPDAAATRDPAHWAELIVKEQVTLWNSVPAFMEMLVEHLESVPDSSASAVLHSLRLVLMSGDWIPVTLPERLGAFTSGTRIVSLGGPTETTVWDICYPIQSVDPEWKSIPYGQPMANAHYYVLDEALNLRPTWVPGELYIGGAGLARGYWHDEEKTASKFIYHPRLGERLYRSGDWGRYLPDGNIEFGGRADFQIKIQGYRVELGEIEAALEQNPLIRSAVVTAASQPQMRPRLVAYVVPRQEEVESKPQPPSEGAVTYALERIDFKLKQLGLRHELSRTSSISLVKPAVDEALTATYQQRQSFRKFLQEPIAFEQLNKFLDNLLQIQVNELPLPKYRYPSAGNLYPVQTYLYVKPDKVEGVDGGVYYYHPREHCLVLLSSNVEIDRSIHGEINRPTFDQSAFSVFLISQYDAITPLYGDLARDFCTLEAGYMSQLLMMSAPDCEIGLCPVGNLDFAKIREHFKLQDNQVLIHSLLGGRLDPNQSRSWASVQRAAQSSASSQAKPNGTITKELQDFLRTKLPDYMVPSTFVVLDTLPLTPNGKVDRKLLPAPDDDPSERVVAHVKPRNAVEQTIATIVQDLLKVKDVGINDSFFELGGNSVDMVRFHGKLRETFNKDISIVDMFANPTITRLVKLFSQEEDTPTFKHSHDRAETRRASRNQRRQSRQEQR